MTAIPKAPRAAKPLDLTGFAEWIVDRGLRGLPLEEQVDGFCRRVVDAGFPARRFNMLIGTLHPRHGARSLHLAPGGLVTDEFPRRRSDEESEAYLSSPIYHLRNSGESRLRRRLDTGAPLDFPLLEDLREAGMTDYAARLVRFDVGAPGAPAARAAGSIRPHPNPMQGIFFSCATDVPGGFDDGAARAGGRRLPYLALAVKSRSTFDVASTLLETYLGADAGRPRADGRDRPALGAADPARSSGFATCAASPAWRAAFRRRSWSRSWTRISRSMARPVLDNRGQILKFLGDGFLATFDLAERDR